MGSPSFLLSAGQSESLGWDSVQDTHRLERGWNLDTQNQGLTVMLYNQIYTYVGTKDETDST